MKNLNISSQSISSVLLGEDILLVQEVLRDLLLQTSRDITHADEVLAARKGRVQHLKGSGPVISSSSHPP